MRITSKAKNKNLNELNRVFEHNSYFKLNPVPMFIYSPKTYKFLDVNPAALKMYGYSREEFLSLTIADIRPKEDMQKLEKMFESNRSVSRVTGYWRHKKKDDSIVFVDVYSHKIEFPPYGEARFVSAFDVTKKKIADESLIQSERRFRDLAEMLPQIIFEFDLEGNLIYANQLAFDTFQYPGDTDLKTINIFNLISPSDLEIARNDLAGIIQNREIERKEYTLYKKDGTSFPAIIIASPIIQNSNPVGFRGVIMDMTEIKNVHRELIFSQKKYSSLFENAQSIMMIVDPENGKIVDANKAVADFYGYDVETLKKMFLTEIVALPEEEIKDSINKALNLKQNQFIRQHKLSNGEKRYVEVFTSPISINDKILIFSVIHDIQNRVLAEANLKKLNKAIEQSPVSVVITDCKGNIEYVNPKFCEVTGYSCNEAIGKNPRILKSGEQDDAYYKKLWTTITSGKNWYGEFKNQKKNGEFYWESASVSPLFDDDGNITHFVAIKEDITERKMKEAELLQAKELAEKSNQLKSNFLTNMSHELRTPLVGILGYADILANELKNGEYKEMAETILQSGNQLIETLNSILDLSRIEADRNELEVSTIEVKEILNETYALFKPMAYSKNLYLKLNLPLENLYVNADRQLIPKIFNNLLNNAIKFTFKGGIIISSNVVLKNHRLFVQTDISDTGIGIPAEYHQLIFEPFRQVSEGLSRSYTGSGLGLTLTKKFVEILNGDISFKSKENQGTTFTVTFPFAHSLPGSQVEDKAGTVQTTTELKLNYKPSLLLVEDDVVNAQIIIAYLSPHFNINHVEDGHTGIDFCKEKNYDVILMDIALKGISGTTAMHEIKKLGEHYSKIPIVAITAFAMLGDKESFLKEGFSHYISKPFTRSQLFKLLTSIFN